MKKNWRYVYSFRQNSRTWWTHRRTDGRTPHDSIGRACIARQKVTKDPIGPQERRYATLWMKHVFWSSLTKLTKLAKEFYCFVSCNEYSECDHIEKFTEWPNISLRTCCDKKKKDAGQSVADDVSRSVTVRGWYSSMSESRSAKPMQPSHWRPHYAPHPVRLSVCLSSANR